MAAVFESYWESDDFVPYDRGGVRRANRAGAPTARRRSSCRPTEIHLRPFQERLLEQIEVARRHGPPPQPARRCDRHRQDGDGGGRLRTAATRRCRGRDCCSWRTGRRSSSRAGRRSDTRCATRASVSSGSASTDPQRFEHVFASIQSLNAVGLEALDPDALRRRDRRRVPPRRGAVLPSAARARRAASSCSVSPPRRNEPTASTSLRYFDGRIAAELRVWDAIDQQYLVPFTYYGVHDGLDLTQVPWRRGQGYDVDALDQRLHGERHLGRPARRTSCAHASPTCRRCGRSDSACRVEHARFMARQFEQRGIAARAVWGDSSPARATVALCATSPTARVAVAVHRRPLQRGHRRAERRHAPAPAPDGERHAVPAAARPRPAPSAYGKSECTVLDFVGLHRREFRFDLRYRALLGGSRHDLAAAARTELPVPPGRLSLRARSGRSRDRAREHPERDPDLVGPSESPSCARSATFPCPRSWRTAASSSTTSTPTTAAGPSCDGPPACRRRRRRTDETAAASSGRPPAARRRRRTHRPLPRLRRSARRRWTSARSTSETAACCGCSSHRCSRTATSDDARSGLGARCELIRRCCAELAELFDELDAQVDHLQPMLSTSRARAAPSARPVHTNRDPGRVRRRGRRCGRHGGTAA